MPIVLVLVYHKSYTSGHNVKLFTVTLLKPINKDLLIVMD